MIDKFCKYLTDKIKKEMPDIDDEQAEVIMYGIQLIIGEIPKVFSVFIVGAICGLWWQTLIAFWILLPYKYASGGFHLKSHIGCFIGTNLIYCGNAYLSTIVNLNIYAKIGLIVLNLIVGIIMITKYAPADTINLPILTKKERKMKKILSYIFLIINMAIAIVVPNNTISNILIFGTLVQTFSITRLAYKITKNEYGYEAYVKENI
ncbi:MAG: accessory gene regulator B family protein [Clostridia bacterium]|nr:accessory gene regulator B family protein [Clostridia bacterium]